MNRKPRSKTALSDGIRRGMRLLADTLLPKEALAYRDALMLALLATRPLRVKNFATLELGRHLVDLEDSWLITIPAAETKTRQPVSFELPEPLLPWFDRYLAAVRRPFPQAAESSRRWLGREGVMRDSHAIYHRITKLTQRLFGSPINPHLLRDCAASSLAAVSSDMARAAAPLLGHRHFSTTERYYIQADNLAASRRLGAILDQLKAAAENLA